MSYNGLNRRVEGNLLGQQRLLDDLFKEKFVLIILDACRYDSFEKLYPSYLKGRLKPVKSPASWTPAWLRTIFKTNREALGRTKIFSSTPFLNSQGVEMNRFQSTNFIAGEQIIDVWKDGWDHDMKSVSPNTLVRKVEEEGIKDQTILWFIQPHWPYIGKKRLSEMFPTHGFFPIRDPKSRTSNTADPSLYISQKIIENKISRESVVEAYQANLEYVLSEIKVLLDHLKSKGRVVVTSDHGELLGEKGVYLHPAHLRWPELRIVPWLDVTQE